MSRVLVFRFIPGGEKKVPAPAKPAGPSAAEIARIRVSLGHNTLHVCTVGGRTFSIREREDI